MDTRCGAGGLVNRTVYSWLCWVLIQHTGGSSPACALTLRLDLNVKPKTKHMHMWLYVVTCDWAESHGDLTWCPPNSGEGQEHSGRSVSSETLDLWASHSQQICIYIKHLRTAFSCCVCLDGWERSHTHTLISSTCRGVSVHIKCV